MAIRETWTNAQKILANKVYNALLALNPSLDDPASRQDIADEAGIPIEYVSPAMFWVNRVIAPSEQVHIGSLRGPGGGYYLALDRDEVKDSAVREYRESMNRALRINGQVRGGSSLLPKVTRRRLEQKSSELVSAFREALTDLGQDPGDIKS